MEILKTFLLGVIQGLTEFLPVSSSGHLVLAKTFMGVDEPGMLLEVMLHLATGIAVLFVFRKDIISIIQGCFSSDTVVRKDSLNYSGWVIVATIPAALVGKLLKNQIETTLFNTSQGLGAAYITSSMLFVTAALLIFSSMRKGGDGKLNWVKVIAIGLIQAVAIMPGISRSGSTIAMALILGVSRDEAGRFSFMLALPVIFGAALLQARDVESWSAIMTPGLIVGFIASLAVGIVALKLLLTFIRRGKLHYFGYYCVAAAVVSLACLTFLPSLAGGGG